MDSVKLYQGILLIDADVTQPTAGPQFRNPHPTLVAQVLELMKEVSEDGEDEGTGDLSPYQSDSDSAVMMSGNSPFISKVTSDHTCRML